MKNNTIKVTYDDGQEKEFEVLFTYRLDEYNKNYVFFTDPNTNEANVMSYEEDNLSKGKLKALETDEEFSKLQEIFEKWADENIDEDDDEEIDECSTSGCLNCSCNGGCGC